MKKNIVFGMLVSLLAIPTYSLAQEVAPAAPLAPNEAISAEEAAIDTAVIDSAAPAAKRTRTKKNYNGLHYSAGHVVSVGFGAGCSGMVVTGDNVNSKMDYPSYNVSLRYTYYFRKFIGFTTGVEFSTYRAKLGLQGTLDWATTTFGTNEALTPTPYAHRLNFDAQGPTGSQWTEIEDISMVEVPIALSFKAKPDRVGFIGTLGLKLAFPVKATYKYKGTLNHTGYFGQDYLESQDYHFRGSEQYESEAIKYNNKVLSVINAEAFAEAGIIFQVHPRVDMSLSIYGGYCLNNVNGTSVNEREQLGFKMASHASQTNTAMNVSFMNEYKGLIGTNAVNRLNPFNCGVKLALHINCREKSDEQIAAEAYIAPDVVYVYDTVRQVKTEVVHDTIVREVRSTVVDSIPAILKQKNLIYYKVGDSSNPICEPSDLVEQLAAALVATPSARIIIAGHASPDGNPEFNQKLSLRRAQTIASMLRVRGVKDAQMKVESFGSSQSLHLTGKDAAVKDRRVEIIPVEK